jgi:hypothetical protein
LARIVIRGARLRARCLTEADVRTAATLVLAGLRENAEPTDEALLGRAQPLLASRPEAVRR